MRAGTPPPANIALSLSTSYRRWLTQKVRVIPRKVRATDELAEMSLPHVRLGRFQSGFDDSTGVAS
jgi:hypothetical protein